MKKLKFLTVVLSLFLSVFPFGCNSKQTLAPFVTELQSTVMQAESGEIKLKAVYGFKTENGKHAFYLTVKLIGKETDNATYTLNFSYGGKNYSDAFKLNPVTNTLTVKTRLDDFDCKPLPVTVSWASTSEALTLTPLAPDGTVDYITAVDSLLVSQSALIDLYRDEFGNFNGSIKARILVKDGKPYWYIGLISANGNEKALLVDGISLEVLAIRDIF